MPAKKRPRPKRTQAERRAETRAALLDAAIESLLNVGPEAITTRGVARLAGVSQGAQQHYFPSKTALIASAMSFIVDKLSTVVARQIVAKTGEERARAEQMIDRLWEAHNLPLARRVFSILHMARDDVEISRHVGKVLAEGVSAVHKKIEVLLPNLSMLPGFTDWLMVAASMMRGTVLMTMLPGVHEGYATWPVVRKHILADLDQLILTGRPAGQISKV